MIAVRHRDNQRSAALNRVGKCFDGSLEDTAMPTRTKRLAWKAALLLLVTSPCTLGPCACIGLPELLAWASSVPFDSDSWKSADGRGRMVYDLRHGRLMGKTKHEVEEMLGAGDDRFNPREWWYPLSHDCDGVMWWEGGDSTFLVVVFDKDVVVEVRIRGF
jgi:hypothetical protein